MLKENQIRRGKNIVKWIWLTFDEAHMNRTRFHSLYCCFVRLVEIKKLLRRTQTLKVEPTLLLISVFARPLISFAVTVDW